LNLQSENTSDLIVHARNIQQMLGDMVDHPSRRHRQGHEPKTQALFETFAQVLIGLRSAREIAAQQTAKKP
jgi:hypothetical protein